MSTQLHAGEFCMTAVQVSDVTTARAAGAIMTALKTVRNARQPGNAIDCAGCSPVAARWHKVFHDHATRPDESDLGMKQTPYSAARQSATLAEEKDESPMKARRRQASSGRTCRIGAAPAQ